jgi:hypothetical protein
MLSDSLTVPSPANMYWRREAADDSDERGLDDIDQTTESTNQCVSLDAMYQLSSLLLLPLRLFFLLHPVFFHRVFLHLYLLHF